MNGDLGSNAERSKENNVFKAVVSNNKGNSTVEYVIVTMALLAIVVGLATISNRLEEGLFVQHAADSASHSVGLNTMGVIGDVLLY